jgi:flagellar hook-length control protein FliK
MQVNLSTNLPAAAGESSARSSAPSDTGSANTFFAQMGQALNPNEEDTNPQGPGKPADAAQNTVGQDPMSLLLSAALVSSQPVAKTPVPAQNLKSSASKTEPVSAGCEPKTADKPVKKSPENSTIPVIGDVLTVPAERSPIEIANLFTPVATAPAVNIPAADGQSGSQTDNSPQAKAGAPLNSQMKIEVQDISATAMDSPKEIFRNIISAADPAVDAGTIASNVISKSQPDLKDSESSGSSLSESLSLKADVKAEADVDTVSERPNLSINLQNKSDSAIGKAAVNPAEQGISRSGSVWLKAAPRASESTQQDVPSLAKIHSEANESSTSRTGWHSDIKGADIVTKAEPSQDAVLQTDFSKSAILKKQESFTQSNTGNANAGDSYANQGQSRDEPVARPAQSIKLEISQPGFSQIRASAGEQQQDVQSAFSLNSVRTSQAGNLTSESAAPASTSQPREFIAQLADQICVQVRDGKEEIRIQLKPDSLGHIEIKAETTSNGVTARITTESSNVKSYLENNLQFLQQTLQDQGLKVDRIHIVVQDVFDSQSQSGYTPQFGHAGSGQNGREPQPQAHASGSSGMMATEEMTVDPITWLSLNPNNRFYTVA